MTLTRLKTPRHNEMRTSEYALSVIIPFYNNGKTISRTIESVERALIASEDALIQIIFIDNNSSDASKQIVEDYRSKRASEVKMLFEPTQGVSHARNCGIHGANGLYISFIDADDIVSEDYFVVLIKAISLNSDLIFAPLLLKVDLFKGKEFEFVNVSIKRFAEIMIGWWNVQFIFRKSLACGLYFYGECYEDIGFFSILVNRCRSITIVNGSIYSYLSSDGSITSKCAQWRLAQLEAQFKERKLLELLDARELKQRLASDYFSMKARLRGMSGIWPVLTVADIRAYAKVSPRDFIEKSPSMARLVASVAKRCLCDWLRHNREHRLR